MTQPLTHRTSSAAQLTQHLRIHQIRKMVGMALLCVRYGLDAPAVIATAFTANRYSLPVAPSVGLMLNEVFFSKYEQELGGKACGRDSLNFQHARAEFTEFKMGKIYPEVVRKEREEWVQWCYTDHLHTVFHRYLPTPLPAGQRPEAKAAHVSGGGAKKVTSSASQQKRETIGQDAPPKQAECNKNWNRRR